MYSRAESPWVQAGESRACIVKHCDDYIDDETQPLCLRRFLRFARWPATYHIRAKRLNLPRAGTPTLYADMRVWLFWKVRVRVVFASRMGDVGITRDLKEQQYRKRVALSSLSNFNTQA